MLSAKKNLAYGMGFFYLLYCIKFNMPFTGLL